MREEKHYLGEYLLDDIHAFCHVKWSKNHVEGENYEGDEIGVVRDLRAHHNGYTTYSIAALLLNSKWFVYRNMMWHAIAIEIIGQLYGILFGSVLGAIFVAAGIKMNTVIEIIVMVVYWLTFCGTISLLAIPMYDRFIHRRFTKRGILNRDKVYNEKLAKSLAKEGKPSVLRVILYVIVLDFISWCVTNGSAMIAWRMGQGGL